MTDDRGVIDLKALEPGTDDERIAAAQAVARHRDHLAAVEALERLTTFERELARRAYGTGREDVGRAVEQALGRGETIRTDVVKQALHGGPEALKFTVHGGPYPALFADGRAADLVLRTRELAERMAEAPAADGTNHLEHFDTEELELMLEGLDLLLAGDEPDESATECVLYNALHGELDTRDALQPGGTVRPSGWPHKGLLVLELAELEALGRALPDGRPDLPEPLQRAIGGLHRELERVRHGFEEGFR